MENNMSGPNDSPIRYAARRRTLAVFALSSVLATIASAQDTLTVRLTLDDAQQRAQVANAPLMRLGELQVEAARQHRLGVTSLYFPSVTTQFENLHLSERPGELLTFQRPLTGGLLAVPTGVVAQDQNAVNVVVAQPLTQLFGVRQLVRIARADENIARAKAGMPLAEAARQVEKNFFDLLVAQRELAATAGEAKKVRASWATVGADALRADAADTLAAGRVATLTASLNGLLGLPLDTELELVPPTPLAEHLTLTQALARAQGSPALEVIEAEQTAVKAHSAARLAKLEYGPGIAIIGGYLHQSALSTTVLPEDFAYVGVVATYTLFDSLKRERTVKETAAQAQAASLGVQLAKDKAAAAVKTAYFELERSRAAYHFAVQILAATQASVRPASDSPDLQSSRARAEADVFRAESGYRAAYASVMNLIARR
jgi:outer membrane protein TolC